MIMWEDLHNMGKQKVSKVSLDTGKHTNIYSNNRRASLENK